MAAVAIIPTPDLAPFEARPLLRLVANDSTSTVVRYGPTLQARRAMRARMMRRRRRTIVAAALVSGMVLLALPGHAFGGTTGAGLSGDLASSSVLASGMDYVVQPGDTVSSIAQLMNPVDPQLARTILVHQLDSNTVVVGEHVVIP